MFIIINIQERKKKQQQQQEVQQRSIWRRKKEEKRTEEGMRRVARRGLPPRGIHLQKGTETENTTCKGLFVL